MSNISTEVWTGVKDLVDAGWLERDEVEHACRHFGREGKPGIGRKIVEVLRERANNPVHRRQQAAMHHFKIDRLELLRFLAIGHAVPLTVASIKSAVGETCWKAIYKDGLEQDGWLTYQHRANGTIQKVEMTEKLRNLLQFYYNWEDK